MAIPSPTLENNTFSAESYNNLPSVEESDKELTKRQNFDEFLKSLR
ncbi:5801_t:CDS:1, partial [Funneliformis geosporum]